MTSPYDMPESNAAIPGGKPFQPVTLDQIKAVGEHWLHLASKSGTGAGCSVRDIRGIEVDPPDAPDLRLRFFCIGQDGRRYNGYVAKAGYTSFRAL